MMLNPVIKLNVIEQWKLKNNMGNDFSINSRVESKIHRIISETVIHNIKDPRLKKISINEVTLSSDLGHAKIYCSMLDASETNNMEIINIMNKASGVFKKNIGKRISLKKIPELNFILDDHENYANQLTDLIDSAIKNDSKK